MALHTSKSSALDIIQSKIYTRNNLPQALAVHRFKSEKIVFTNGCFDIIHRGHIHYLAKASDLGHYFVVGVNSDASVRRLGKSSARPFQDEQTRALILASFHFVQAVIIFDQDTPAELIQLIKPDVLVKGADYDAEERDTKSKKYIVGSDTVKEYGGKIQTIEYLTDFSTTAIEQKISAVANTTAGTSANAPSFAKATDDTASGRSKH
jgi:rfaE bifunctional protein nucleotidyltransferase chain/domain